MAKDSGSIRFTGIWNSYAYILVFGLIYFEWSFSALVAQQIPGMITVASILCLISPLLLLVRRVEFDKGSLIIFFFIAALILLNCLRDGDFSKQPLAVHSNSRRFFYFCLFLDFRICKGIW